MPIRYRWAWTGVLFCGVGLFLAVLRTLESTGNPNLLPALVLLGAAVVPVTFVVFVYGRQLTVDVPGGVVTVVALVSGIVGIVVAGTLEYDVGQRYGAAAALLVGFIEEAAKLVVPVLLALVVSERWRAPADGLVIGVATGAGFAALETMGYAFVELVRARGEIGPVVSILLVRGLLSPAAHLAWTGLTVAGLWWARWRRWQARSVLLALLAYLVAVVMHTVWDAATRTAINLAVAGVSLLILFLVAHRVGQVQARERLDPPMGQRPLPAAWTPTTP